MDINQIQNIVKKDGIIFLTYGGFLSQALISGMTEALEKEAEQSDLNMGDSNNIFTIFIELAQNMMNYSKNKDADELKSEGLILVGKDKEGNYYIHSQNIITSQDKDKIEEKLSTIKTLSKDEIKKTYRELRRSGRHAHGKGGGIGFYEIAKRCSKIDYEFKIINEDRHYFHFKATVETKQGEK